MVWAITKYGWTPPQIWPSKMLVWTKHWLFHQPHVENPQTCFNMLHIMFLVFFSDWFTAGLLWFEPSTKFVFKHTHTNLWLTINKTCFSTQQTLAFQHQTMSLTARVFMPRTWEVHDPILCFHHEIMLVSSTRTMLLMLANIIIKQGVPTTTTVLVPSARSWKINLNKKWRERQPRYAGDRGNMEQILTDRWKIGFFFWWDDWWVATHFRCERTIMLLCDYRLEDSR